jgi:hypothetical protein
MPARFSAALNAVRLKPHRQPLRFPAPMRSKHRRLPTVASAKPPRLPTSVLATLYWLGEPQKDTARQDCGKNAQSYRGFGRQKFNSVRT